MKTSFKKLEQYRLTEKHLGKDHPMASNKSFGRNGVFAFDKKDMTYRIIVSDGGGWEHVSVSILDKNGDLVIPSWEDMCFIKNLFWGKNETVVQYHPAESEYVNFHPSCLHLWKPVNEKIPVPPSEFVGPKLEIEQ